MSEQEKAQKTIQSEVNDIDKPNTLQTNDSSKWIGKEEVLRKLKAGESFEGVEIGYVDFSKHIFDYPIDFRKAIFKGVAKFSEAIFESKTDFSETTYEGNVNFINAKFNGYTLFRKTVFKNDVLFYIAKFKENTNFDGTLFKGRAHFGGVKFENTVDFEETTFEETYFYLAKFEDEVNFNKAMFGNETYFRKATFKKEVNFKETYFHFVSFQETNFIGYTYFYDTVFAEKTVFTSSKFFDLTIFRSIQPKGEYLFSDNNITLLNDIIFYKPEIVRFERADFRKCLMYGTEWSKVTLSHIKWNDEYVAMGKGIIGKGKRFIIYDEKQLSKDKKDYEAYKEIYCQLKQNFESKVNYGDASGFHVSEMEMCRSMHKHSCRLFCLTWWYKILAGYGESIKRTLCGLILILLISSISYFWNGIEIKLSNTDLINSSSSKVINYCLEFPPKLHRLQNPQLWPDLGESILHSIEVATFRRDFKYESINIFGRFIEIFQMIASTIQITLIILAVKRKFKR